MCSLNKKQNNLKVGLLYLDNYDFEGDKYKIAEKGITSFSKFAEQEKITLKVFNSKIRTSEDARAITQQVEKENFDFLILLIGTFPSGEALLPILSKPWRIGLWSVPEPTKSGPLPLNSFSGTNLAMSISKEFLKRTIPLKYFFGWLNDPKVRKRFKITFRALKGLKSIENSKIGLLVGLAPGYYDLDVNRKILKKLFNIEITDVSYKFIKKIIGNLDENEVNKRIKLIKSISPCKISTGELKKAAQIDLSIVKIVNIYNLDAIGLGCWPEFLDDFGAAPCSSVARITQEEVPVACEGDLRGAIDMLILQGISNQTPVLMDLIAMDKKDNSLCFWHCGAAAPQMARGNCELKNVWWNFDLENRKNTNDIGSIYDLKLNKGNYTIYRGMDNGKKTFIGSGTADLDKSSWVGGKVWIENLKIGRVESSAYDFANTIMVQGVPHHYALVKGDWKEVLFEFAAWTGSEVLPLIPYSDALVNLNTRL